MTRSTVVLAACPDYDPDRVLGVVRESIAKLGFSLPSDGKTVLLKPNMLRAATAEKAVTTHPAVFAAAGRYFKDLGRRVAFGDSPNAAFKEHAVAERSGLLEAADALGMPLVDFEAGEDVSFPAGVQNRRFHVASAVMKSHVVNMPKLKTHALATMTGALKNTFGVVPGILKPEFHIKHPDVEGFSRMIVDLNRLVKPALVIMDAIHAMEGNGPGAGTVVKLGLLLFSTDPVAVDAVACRLIGVDPLSLPMLRFAEETGLGHASEQGIRIVGEDVGAVAAKSFALPFRGPPGAGVPDFLMRFARNRFVPKPVVDKTKCRRCGECVKACPTAPKSIQANGGIPKYTYRSCIRCYCCQEVCPHGAISVKVPLARGLLGR